MRPLAFLLLLTTAPVLAQEAPPAEAAGGGILPAGCTYQTCALRAETNLLGMRIVRGEAGQTVAEPGLFGGINLGSAVAGSPAALEHVQRYEASRTRSYLALGVAVGFALLGSYALEDDRTDLAVTSYIAMIGATTYGSLETMAAQRELSRALWAYNGEFARE